MAKGKGTSALGHADMWIMRVVLYIEMTLKECCRVLPFEMNERSGVLSRKYGICYLDLHCIPTDIYGICICKVNLTVFKSCVNFAEVLSDACVRMC